MLKQQLPPPRTSDAGVQRVWPVREHLPLPSLGLRTSERRLLLLLVDFGLVTAALVFAIRARTPWLDQPGSFLILWPWWSALALVWWVVSHLTDSYDLARAANAQRSMLAAGSAAGLTALAYEIIPVVTPPLASLGLNLAFAVDAIALVAAWRGLYSFLFVLPALADVVFAALALALLAAAIPLVAVADLAGNRGPLCYRQTRVGKGGRTFRVIKFRTMRPDAEATTGAAWATAQDPRVTPVGRMLRKTRLDELPQILNVLAGQMSVIGPRPERSEFVDRLAKEIPFYKARHAVRPGLTGWAQVRFGYGSSVADARTKLEYETKWPRCSRC